MSCQDARWTDLDAGLTRDQLGAVERAVARPRPDGDCVFVHHRVPHPTCRIADGLCNVARCMFETDRVPRTWLEHLIKLDEIWVPSDFNVETFQRGGVPGDRLRVLPGTLDFDVFKPGVEPLELEAERSFTFLSNFDFTDRKGWDVLLDAWAEAFGPDDDVCLMLKYLSMHMPPEDVRRRIDVHLGARPTAPIVLSTDVLSVADLPRLYAAVDRS